MRKAAKVYEAGESVEGNKPKVVYESHKKCTPCEFGMRVKAAFGAQNSIGGEKLAEHMKDGPQSDLYGALQTMSATGLVGSGIGALVGAARAPRGKRLRTALGDAAVGGAAGLGFGAGTEGGIALGMPHASSLSAPYFGGLGGGLGAVGAGALAHKIRNEMEEDYDNNASPLLNAIAKQGAYKQSDDLQSMVMGTTRDMPSIGGAAGAGAGLGALIGALRAPKGKMLKYTLGGAGIGGLAGAGSAAAYNLVPSNAPTETDMLRLPLAVGGGALGGHLGNKLYDEVEHHIPEKKDKKEKTEKSALSHDGLDVLGLGMAGAGAGGVYGGLAGLVGGGIHGALSPGHTTTYDDKGNVVGQKRRNRLLGALRRGLGYGALGAGAGATVGGLGGAGVEAVAPGTFRNAIGNDAWQNIHKFKFQNDWNHAAHQAAGGVNALMEKRQSAFEFGQKVAFAVDWNALKNPALGGAALGALAGGVHGLVAPGEDEDGKQRSRFGAMLRGALGGGAIGGLGGAAMGHFAPGPTQDLYNRGRQMLTGKTQAQLNMGDNVARMTPQQQAQAQAMTLHRRPAAPALPSEPPEPISFPQPQ